MRPILHRYNSSGIKALNIKQSKQQKTKQKSTRKTMEELF